MSRKWLEQEGKNWVEQKIITDEQYGKILELYPPHQRRMQLLPVLASILLGLSLLTFVASNWDGMSHTARLIFLILTMIGFYTSGYSFYRKGHQWVGQGLLTLGVVSFGASMILVGQMYHLIAYDARLFFFWALSAIGIMYLIRRSFFFYLASALIVAGQFYALTSFGQMSYLLLGVTILALGAYAYQAKRVGFGIVVSLLVGFQLTCVILDQQLPWLWIGIVPFALYVIGVWLDQRPIATGFKLGPNLFGFGFAVLMVFLHDLDGVYDEHYPDPVVFATIFILLLLLAMLKIKNDWKSWLPVLLFLPLFWFDYGGFFYLIIMFVYASFLIYVGDDEQQAWKANIGVFLFLVSSIVGYVQLAWDFLDKSIFFLLGGILLLFIHWVLRRRDQWLAKGSE